MRQNKTIEGTEESAHIVYLFKQRPEQDQSPQETIPRSCHNAYTLHSMNTKVRLSYDVQQVTFILVFYTV